MEEPKKPAKLKLKLNLTGRLDRTPSFSAIQEAAVSITTNNNMDAMSLVRNGAPVTTPAAISPPPIPSGAAMSPGANTPISAGGTRIKLKKPSIPALEAPPPRLVPLQPQPNPVAAPTTTKAGRTSKPTAKKRSKADAETTDEDDGVDENGVGPAKKKIKVKRGGKTPNGPIPVSLRIKDTHKAAQERQHGDGYDSEMEDAEKEPYIEDQIVLRMMEGSECDYLNANIDGKKTPGQYDFKLKWLDERRACVTVNTQPFAAYLVDMPTITEGMKTWDKKSLVKSADICQMLLVFAKVKDETEARIKELPKVIFDGHRWPHGLTPPMHDCVHRRFRKRLTKKEINNKEQEVERLLEADKNAISTRLEWVDERRGTTAAGTPDYDDGDEDQDAEGEMDDEIFYHNNNGGVDEDALDADLEAELMAEMDAEHNMPVPDEVITPAQVAVTPMTANTATPAAGSEDAAGQDADDLFDEDDEDDDDESEEGLDPEERERREQIKGVREEVKEIDKAIAMAQQQVEQQANHIIQRRMQLKLNQLKEDRRLKLASIGEQLDEDDE